MEKAEEKRCPKCKRSEGQMNAGYNRSGTQRCVCWYCKYKYTPAPITIAYSEEIRRIAIREYYSGVSGRGVGKIHNMSKANVYNWIKKNGGSVDK